MDQTYPSTFFRFCDLPYELRHEIYILGTPPRLVYVREGFPSLKADNTWMKVWEEPWDAAFVKFADELLQGSLGLNIEIHPELRYFAHNWCHEASRYSPPFRQTFLEAYGFTSQQARKQPWPPTIEAPELSVDLLARSPELSFELARQSYLYSVACIPSFLHVCTESRQALIRWGYQLTFATRSHAPRTWFNYSRDRLYIPKADWTWTYRDAHREMLPETIYVPSSSESHALEHGRVLSGCSWDFGQFRVQDLLQLKCVVLGDGAGCDVEAFRNMLPLLPNLEELFIEERGPEDIEDWFMSADVLVKWRKQEDEDGRSISCEANPLVCIAVGDVDVVGSVFWHHWRNNFQDLFPYLRSTGDLNRHWFRGMNEDGRDYFTSKAEHLVQILSSDPGQVGFEPQRKTINIAYVHVCLESLSQQFLSGRYNFWKAFTTLQKMLSGPHDPFLDPGLKSPSAEPPFNFGWDIPSAMGLTTYETCQNIRIWHPDPWPSGLARLTTISGIGSHDSLNLLRAWYLARFTVPEPKQVSF